MRKILVSALILFVLIGLMLPASAGSYEKKKCCEKPKPKECCEKLKPPCCEKPKQKECCGSDLDINNAEVTQTQTAIPISIDNYNSAWFGGAGTQDIYQSQYSDVDQSNE